VPGWLAEVVRQRRAPVPWADMARAALAICVPLSVAFAAGRASIGVLPAMGGLLGTLADTGGPYLTRVKRVGAAVLLGGGAGLTIGAVIHGHGWVAVIALVCVAGVSGLLSSTGDLGSVAGLQLLVYTGLGLGPVGAERPVWHVAVGFVVGGAWALLLILPGWLWSPYGKEQQSVGAVYAALAAKLAAIGTAQVPAARQQVTAALNLAYDELLTVRARSSGRNQRTMRLVALLNASHQVAEASTALALAGDRPPPLVIDVVRRLATSILDGDPPPLIPPVWDLSAGAVALRDALAGAVRVLTSSSASSVSASTARAAGTARSDRLVGPGRVGYMFTLRLMACIFVASVCSEVLPLERSYWVVMTVAIVMKPDYGSVFARAMQRGLGTMLGAVVGAVLLVLVHGVWLLVPFAILAALLPLGRSRNYGLLAVFLTPLVVVLISLLKPGGWHLAGDRLLDTVIGCAIVLFVGFLPWWTSWYVHLPGQFGVAADLVCTYMVAALVPSSSPDASSASSVARLRRGTYRAIADLRADFQRTMSEPPAISRRASAWWPAVVGLEGVMDAVTAAAVSVHQGAALPADQVREISSALRTACVAAVAGAPVPVVTLTGVTDEELAVISSAVRSLAGVLDDDATRLTLLPRCCRAGRIRTGDLLHPTLADTSPADKATVTITEFTVKFLREAAEVMADLLGDVA
jgi:uncharacterized membrane protein YccC